MSILEKVEERTQRWRADDVDWRKQTERSIESRFKRGIWIQFLLALLAAVVALIAAKLLPFFGL